MAKSSVKIASVVKVLLVGPVPMPSQTGDNFVFRVEILRDLKAARVYAGKIWRIEHYRIEPSFPRRKGRAKVYADEAILVEDVALDTGLTGMSVGDVQRKALARISEVLGLK
jgi:hypothetical protein